MSSPTSPEPAPEQPLLPAEWLDLVTTDGAVPPAASEEAVDALARARGHVRALAELSELTAPVELAGLVVASLNAGARQDRAVEYASSLPALEAPAVLDDAVAAVVDGDLTSAPAVLDRLVEERVEAPGKTMARSMTGRLEKHSAPSELDGRVRRELLLEGQVPRGAKRRLASAVAASVLAVVLIVAAQRMLPSAPQDAAPAAVERVVSLRIERVTVDELTASDRAFLGMMGGPL